MFPCSFSLVIQSK
jgi:NADPH:quinone reductase-like Zn-dependent oxidoreductase